MTEKKYQVFISSTYTDLIDARRAVYDTVLSLYHFPVGMEMFGSDDDEQWKIIEDTIRESDYYLLIIGHRYGSISTEGTSYTEKEFDLAKSLGIPIISFIQNRDVATTPDKREIDAELVTKLNMFVDKAKNGKLVSFWDTVSKLEAEVAKSLPKTMSRHPRMGWIRADKATSPEVMNEFAKVNSENRELREELEKLRALQGNRPSLGVSINNDNPLKLEFKPCFLKSIEAIDLDEIPEHLNPYLSQDEVHAYNKFIEENQGEIARFNKETYVAERIKGNNYDINIEVFNRGRSGSSNIYVDLHFPPELKIIEKDEINQVVEEIAGLPSNPLEKARKNYESKLLRDLRVPSISSLFAGSLPNSINGLSSWSLSNSVLKHATSRTNWTSLEENKLSIHINSLLHTRKMDFGEEYVVVPLKKGEFQIQGTIVCQEYTELESFQIPVIVY
ncbi:DUF4062 domain-containing protein [Paenibacillus sp. NPDC055715]